MKIALRILLKVIRFVVLLLAGVAILYGLFSLIVRPSLTRDWSPDQMVLAHATIDGNTIAIKNIRNIKYRSTTDYDVQYYDKRFDLQKLESLWYIVEPFSGHGAGAAHTLVSFGFEGGENVAISAEIRKERGEKFSPIRGILRQYELVYVIADERDVIKLRSNYRMDDVFLYPVKTSKENIKNLFVAMLERNNKLASEPE